MLLFVCFIYNIILLYEYFHTNPQWAHWLCMHYEHSWPLSKPYTYKLFSYRFVVHYWCHLQWTILQIWITFPVWHRQSEDTAEVIDDCERYRALYWLHISSVMIYLSTNCSLHTYALTTVIITHSPKTSCCQGLRFQGIFILHICRK